MFFSQAYLVKMMFIARIINMKTIKTLTLLALGFATSLSTSLRAASTPERDCKEIQKIIDSASSVPGASKTVVIPSGNYVCNDPIFIEKSNLNIVGEGGSSGVRIKLADNANAPVLVIGSRHTQWMKHPTTGKIDFYTVDSEESSNITVVKNVSLSGISIDGNKDHQSFECWTPNHKGPARKKGEPISNSTCSGSGPSAIRNNGITIRGAEDIEVNDVVLDSNASGGMVTEKYVKNLHVKNMKARNNWFDGFAGYQTTDSIIEDSELSHNQGAGASLDLNFNNNTFLRTSLSHNKHQGVFARELNGNKWIDSEIMCNGYQGVFLASSHSGRVDTARFRLLAREQGFKVGKDLKLNSLFYRKLFESEQKNPQNIFPMAEVKEEALKRAVSPELILEEIYNHDLALKRARCANGNVFKGTKISCSGTQNPDWGTGIRINDDECLNNCIDSETRSIFEALEGSDKNRAGNITTGTIGEVALPDFDLCGSGYSKKLFKKEKTPISAEKQH